MAEPILDPIEEALKDGLSRQPLAQPSADFDQRVLYALRIRRTWWQVLFQATRPVVSAAACSLVATLALLHWTLHSPPSVSPAQSAPTAIVAVAPAEQRFTMAALDRALDQPDVRDSTITRLLAAPPLKLPNPAPPRRTSSPAPPGRPPDPPKRDGLAPHCDPLLA